MSGKVTKLALGGVYLSMTSPAFAYLDGATGSMLLQAMIGGVATAMVFGRAYIAKAKAFFVRKREISPVGAVKSEKSGETE